MNPHPIYTDPTIGLTATPADRLALALCPYIKGVCRTPASDCRHYCRRDSAAVARELAQILRERHGGSSAVADWLDGVGAHA